MITIKLENNQ